MGSTFVSYSSFFLENHQMKDCKMYILALLSRLFTLKYLKNIKWNRVEEPKIFTLELLF
ncbi:unnamed protein product, partial [Brassica oleracea]